MDMGTLRIITVSNFGFSFWSKLERWRGILSLCMLCRINKCQSVFLIVCSTIYRVLMVVFWQHFGQCLTGGGYSVVSLLISENSMVPTS